MDPNLQPRVQDNVPQDLVAVFHASFHPTQGNIIDWSIKASDDLSLEHLEFSALPSGLHSIEHDVVYFTKDNQHGVCVFLRRPTNEPGHRGVRLSSLGILLARSRRPRPWRHVEALKILIMQVYSRTSTTPNISMDITEDDWEPARIFFEERKIRRADLGGAGDWLGWSEELDGAYSHPLRSNPTLHLPHLLQILGPSSLTIYKHVLGRKRILIYTHPPVEVACIMCRVVADMCFEVQCQDYTTDSGFEQGSSTSWTGHTRQRLKGKHREPISVLGMITLADMARLEGESASGKGWVACTTDAIYLEKPSHYDLLIDLTTATSSGKNAAARPTLYSSKAFLDSSSSRPKTTYRLSTIRFAWSDVKLWNEIERILSRSSTPHGNHPGGCCIPPTPFHNSSDPALKNKQIAAWTDAWQVYEDVCILCAGLWMGLGGLSSWRSPAPGAESESEDTNWGGMNHTAPSPNTGAIHLDGDDDLAFGTLKSMIPSACVRNVGMGIEGRPAEASTSTLKNIKRSSAISWTSGRTLLLGSASLSGRPRQSSNSLALEEPREVIPTDEDNETQKHSDLDLWTTLALLQTFHAHTAFQISVLEDVLNKQNKKRKGSAPIIETYYSGASTHSSTSNTSSCHQRPDAVDPSSSGPSTSPSTGTLLPENNINLGQAPNVVTLTPKDILAFELAPMSAFDARYLEWLAKEYASPAEGETSDDIKVILKRGWKDIIGAVLGYV